MKKLLIMITILFTLVLNVNISAVDISANTLQDNLDLFEEKVETSGYYDEYKSTIIEQVVKTEAITDYGLRYTIAYSLDLDNTQTSNLIFVGDENLNIIEALIINTSNEMNEIINLREDFVYVQRVVDCSTFYCTKKNTTIAIVPDGACNRIVGSACNTLSLIPQYGWIATIVCKVGVVVACSVTTDYECVEGRWLNVCPY